MGYCQGCGRSIPTKRVEFYQNIGALVVRFHKSTKGQLCRSCISQVFWPYTATTFILGWWGLISLVVTPFILLNNVLYYLGSLTLPSSTPPIRTPQESIAKPSHTLPKPEPPYHEPVTPPRGSKTEDFFSGYPTKDDS